METGPQGVRKHRQRSGPKSKVFVGVSQYKRTGRYEAHVWDQDSGDGGKGKQLHLGSYLTAAQAARNYDRAVLCLRGADADTNFPRSGYDADPVMGQLRGIGKRDMVLLLRKTLDTPDEQAAMQDGIEGRSHRQPQAQRAKEKERAADPPPAQQEVGARRASSESSGQARSPSASPLVSPNTGNDYSFAETAATTSTVSPRNIQPGRLDSALNASAYNPHASPFAKSDQPEGGLSLGQDGAGRPGSRLSTALQLAQSLAWRPSIGSDTSGSPLHAMPGGWPAGGPMMAAAASVQEASQANLRNRHFMSEHLFYEPGINGNDGSTPGKFHSTTSLPNNGGSVRVGSTADLLAHASSATGMTPGLAADSSGSAPPDSFGRIPSATSVPLLGSSGASGLAGAAAPTHNSFPQQPQQLRYMGPSFPGGFQNDMVDGLSEMAAAGGQQTGRTAAAAAAAATTANAAAVNARGLPRRAVSDSIPPSLGMLGPGLRHPMAHLYSPDASTMFMQQVQQQQPPAPFSILDSVPGLPCFGTGGPGGIASIHSTQSDDGLALPWDQQQVLNAGLDAVTLSSGLHQQQAAAVASLYGLSGLNGRGPHNGGGLTPNASFNPAAGIASAPAGGYLGSSYTPGGSAMYGMHLGGGAGAGPGGMRLSSSVQALQYLDLPNASASGVEMFAPLPSINNDPAARSQASLMQFQPQHQLGQAGAGLAGGLGTGAHGLGGSSFQNQPQPPPPARAQAQAQQRAPAQHAPAQQGQGQQGQGQQGQGQQPDPGSCYDSLMALSEDEFLMLL